jgi:hypothetical protein
VLVEARTHSPDRADQREARQPELPGPRAEASAARTDGTLDERRRHRFVDADTDDVDSDTGREHPFSAYYTR